jgi:hypothetical protein
MKPLLILSTVVVPVLAVSACGKSKDEPTSEPTSSGDKTKDKAAGEAKKAAGPDFSSWDQEGKAAAWQGSWLAKESGSIQAWTVAGDKVQSWDGKEEKTFALVVEAPCHAGFKNDKHMIFPRNFTSVGGTLRFGSAGYRRGAEALFCDDSGDIYMLDAASTCTLWKEKFGDWTATDGECSIKKNAEGVEVFAHGDPNSGEFVIEGDAILPNSSFPTEAVEGDFAAAKTARDAKAVE